MMAARLAKQGTDAAASAELAPIKAAIAALENGDEKECERILRDLVSAAAEDVAATSRRLAVTLARKRDARR